MFTKRLLFLTNHRLVSIVWKRGRASDCQIFALNEEGRLAFARHVQALPGAPAYLLTELVEEDFRSDAIPHVIRRDRRAIVDRRLSQMYRATPYRLGIVQGRELDGRRDDRVLYTAITNPELVKPWVDLLIELGAPVAGVYSAPLLSAELLKVLRITAEHALLVSVETGGGLRQSYFNRGGIKFSRLTPVSEIGRAELPDFIADEVSKTWQYLDSLRYFTRAEALGVFILAHPADHAGILASRPPITQLQYNAVSIRDAARRIGLEDNLTDSDATPIFIHLLGKGPPRGQFATHEETHGMRVWKSRTGLYAASALLVLSSVAWSGFTAYRSASLERQIEHIETQAKVAAQQHQAAVKELPSSSLSPAVMRDSVTLYDALTHSSPSPTRTLFALSQVLEGFPDIRIDQIAWVLSNDPNATPSYTPAAGTDDALVRSGRIDVPATPAEAPGDKATELAYTYQIAVVEAAIQPFNGDYRAVFNEIDRFTQALKSLPGGQVRILSRPVELGSNVTLSGRSATSTGATQARFAVKLTMALAKP
ncbi:MAG: hypothetical protein H0U63_06970 [Burkholderiales bacterium]|nr:hypothetical protein [Burkholderiales bacterium]